MFSSQQRINHFARNEHKLRAAEGGKLTAVTGIKPTGYTAVDKYLADINSDESFYKDSTQHNARYMLLDTDMINTLEFANKLGDNYLLVYEKTGHNLESSLSTGMASAETDLILHTNLLGYLTQHTEPNATGWLAENVKMLFRADLSLDNAKHTLNLFGFIPASADTIYMKNYSIFNNPSEEQAWVCLINSVLSSAQKIGAEVVIFSGVLSKYPLDAVIYYINHLVANYRQVKHIIFVDPGRYSGNQIERLATLSMPYVA